MHYKVWLDSKEVVYFPATDLKAPAANFKARLQQINEQIIFSSAQAVDWEMVEDDEVPA